MEDLAWQYPAEPVERAAVRFCEAVSRWRGKPELETVRVYLITVFSCFDPDAVQETTSAVHGTGRRSPRQ